MRHRYIKPRRPQQNGKVERSHRIDNEEFWGGTRPSRPSRRRPPRSGPGRSGTTPSASRWRSRGARPPRSSRPFPPPLSDILIMPRSGPLLDDREQPRQSNVIALRGVGSRKVSLKPSQKDCPTPGAKSWGSVPSLWPWTQVPIVR
jgi:hypothetical protein